MTEHRWQRVKELFQAAVERPAAERGAFLAAAAGDDDALRREVESLLNSDAADSSFLVGSDERGAHSNRGATHSTRRRRSHRRRSFRNNTRLPLVVPVGRSPKCER